MSIVAEGLTQVFGYEVPKSISIDAVRVLKALSEKGSVLVWSVDLVSNPIDFRHELKNIAENIGLYFFCDGIYGFMSLIDGSKCAEVDFYLHT